MVRSFKNFKHWPLTRELLKQYLTEKPNSYLQTESGLLWEVVSYEEWPLWESGLYNVKPLLNNIIYSFMLMILITSRREVIGAKTFCSTCISYSASSLASNACTLPAFCITSLSWQKITISNKDVINLYNIHYWPSMRPRWLDIGQVFLASLWPETKSRSIKMQKKMTAVWGVLGWTSV